ncbi:MAG: hypothetical protein NW223_20315 [Hyphomicrobiaceae bacterium]|nr:hypothetical protein [Hyphomicrobiaceae bacterium]
MADSEQQLVRGLGEALNVADERLREQVRQFAAEHNQRRTVALEELRALSSKLGALPKGRYDAVRQTAQPLEQDRYIQQGGYSRTQPPSYGSQPATYGTQPQSRYESPAPSFAPSPPPAPTQHAAPAPGAPVTGDWRHAASRIEEEINLYQSSLRARR